MTPSGEEKKIDADKVRDTVSAGEAFYRWAKRELPATIGPELYLPIVREVNKVVSEEHECLRSRLTYLERQNEELRKDRDDYADKRLLDFMRWLSGDDSKLSILYGEQEDRFCSNDRDYTPEQVLQLFKQQNP